MGRFWVRIIKDIKGGTALEYSLIAAFIAMAIIVSVTAVGTQVGIVFTDVVNGFQGAN